MIIIYKGYEVEYLEKILSRALVKNKIKEKIDIKDNNKTAQEVITNFSSNISKLKEEDMWITYEEFSVSYKNIISLAELFNIKIVIYENNKYYNIYPVEIQNTELLD